MTRESFPPVADGGAGAPSRRPAAHRRLARLRSFLRCTLLGLLGNLVLLGLVLAGAGWLLTWPADHPVPADAVVVLGGGGDGMERAGRGIALVQDEWAPRILFFHPPGPALRDAEARFGPAGVPQGRVWLDRQARNSWDEALAARQWMEQQGLRHVLVVSDPPHMLRLRYTWGAAMGDSGLGFTLVATHPAWWSPWGWWRNDRAAEFVGSELVKLGYYLVRRRTPPEGGAQG